MKKITNIRKNTGSLVAPFVLIALGAVVITSVNAQKDDNPSKTKGTQPQVNIKVDKKTDKNDNITRYDSTYSYSWSGNGNIPANIDSMIKSMHERFSKGMLWGLNESFFNDSALFGSNFSGMFDRNRLTNLEKILAEQQKMFNQYFNREPLLKVPEGVAPQQPKNAEKSFKKEKPLIQNNNYSTSL